jgi:hypothetical protein
MMMSDYDDLIADRFPDAEKRAERRKLLHDRLDTFFDTFLEDADGSWLILDSDTIVEMYDIFREIVNLKIARDCDGDSQIEVQLGDRKVERMTTIRVPTKDYKDITEEVDHEYIRDLTNSVRMAGHASDSASLEMESYFRQMRSLRDSRLEKERMIEEAVDIINNADFPEASTAIMTLIKRLGISEMDGDRMSALYETMNRRFRHELEDRIYLAIKQMEPFDTDNDDGWPMVRSFIADSQRIFGGKFGLDVPEYYVKRRELSEKGYAARLAKRKAQMANR